MQQQDDDHGSESRPELQPAPRWYRRSNQVFTAVFFGLLSVMVLINLVFRFRWPLLGALVCFVAAGAVLVRAFGRDVVTSPVPVPGTPARPLLARLAWILLGLCLFVGGVLLYAAVGT